MIDGPVRGLAFRACLGLLAVACHAGPSRSRADGPPAGQAVAGPTRTAEDILRCREMEHARANGQAVPRVALPAEPVRLRSTPLDLPESGCADAARRWNFYTQDNDASGCFVNAYVQNGPVVSDLATGLMWEKGGSSPSAFGAGLRHIQDLNGRKVAGVSDWRLPTTEEMLSLMEAFRFHVLHLDGEVFDPGWTWWTSDRRQTDGAQWVVDAMQAACKAEPPSEGIGSVRAVRAMSRQDVESATRAFAKDR